MGIFDFKKQLSSVIEWKNQDPNIVVQKAQTTTDEIKNASKLLVAPGQGCILVYEGKVQDVLTEPNTYVLDTDNYPFITTLLKLRQQFESEYKMYLYFFRTAEFVNVGWGTASPVKYIDSVYGFPIELGAYGNFSVFLKEPEKFFTTIIGSKDVFTVDDLKELVISRITPALASELAQKNYSFKDIDANLLTLSQELKTKLNQDFADLGLTLDDFRIESATINDDTMRRINQIADIKAESLSAKEAGLDYVQLEKLKALRDAARNQGGLAGAGLQLGAGMEIGKMFNFEKDKNVSSDAGTNDEVAALQKLKVLLDENIITQEEFDAKKKEILSNL